MKTYYYKLKRRQGAGYVIEYWTDATKPDTFTVVTTEEAKIRKMIEEKIGTSVFRLVFVNELR